MNKLKHSGTESGITRSNACTYVLGALGAFACAAGNFHYVKNLLAWAPLCALAAEFSSARAALGFCCPGRKAHSLCAVFGPTGEEGREEKKKHSIMYQAGDIFKTRTHIPCSIA